MDDRLPTSGACRNRVFQSRDRVFQSRDRQGAGSLLAEEPACSRARLGQGTNRRPSAFSLLETTIAVGILGIGLIMVAAIFPVALSEHRRNVDQSRALELTSKARAMIDAKIEAASLWVDAAYLPGGALVGLDSPWYLLPTVNLRAGNDCWDVMLQSSATIGLNLYANHANGAVGGEGNPLFTYGVDILSDKSAPYTLWRTGSSCTAAGSDILPPSASPFTDSELAAAPNHLVWYGFYRRLATGSIEYAAAVCKQRKNQLYAEQDVSTDVFTGATPFTPASRPVYFSSDRRLPVPWRVTVALDITAGNVLRNAAAPGSAFAGTVGIAPLAPVGSRMMVSGAGQSFGTTMLPVPGGRILTVSDVIDDFSVEVIGDLSSMPLFDFASGTGITFDVWIFPPAIEGGTLARESPVVDWRAPL